MGKPGRDRAPSPVNPGGSATRQEMCLEGPPTRTCRGGYHLARPGGVNLSSTVQCNLSGRLPGSATDAHHVLRLVFVLLIGLDRVAANPLLYVRTIGVALMHWQAFNSALPGLCYGEEFGEVMLS